MRSTTTTLHRALILATGALLPQASTVGAAELDYSSYFGGFGGDSVTAVTVAPDDSIVVVGTSGSPDLYGILTRGDCTEEGCLQSDAFVLRLTPDGREVLSGRFLGGSGHDTATGVTVGADGSIYVCGTTKSGDFPIVDATQDQLGRGATDPNQPSEDVARDAFVTKLTSDATTIVYSTYLGGGGDDESTDIAVTSEGRVMVVGHTDGDFTVTEFGYDFSFNGDEDAFVAYLHEGGAQIHGFYLGGSDYDAAFAVEVDDEDFFYVAGATRSGIQATPGAYRTQGQGSSDAWVARIDPTRIGLNLLQRATYLGGTSHDRADTLAIGPEGGIFIAGSTGSQDFPTTSSSLLETCDCYSSGAAGNDGFVAKLSSDLSDLQYATYLGGGERDDARGLAVDLLGRAWITGIAGRGFPVEPSESAVLIDDEGDAFVSVLSPTGRTLSSARTLGGATGGFFISGPRDWGAGVVMDRNGDAVVVGTTWSSGFPTTDDAISPSTADRTGLNFDGWIAKLSKGNYESLAGALTREVTAEPELGAIEKRTLGRILELIVIAAGRGDLEEAQAELNQFIGQVESLAIGQIIRTEVAEVWVALANELSLAVEKALNEAPSFVRGDCNGDAEINISDASCTLNWLFLGGREPGCVAVGNTNGDGEIDISDVSYLLNHLFLGGAPLAQPYPTCGPPSLPTDMALGCQALSDSCKR